MELSTSKDLEKGYVEKIGAMEIEIGGLEADKQTARNQIHHLTEKKDELSKRVLGLTSIAQGTKKAVHDAKVDLAAAYSKLLAGIKEKWIAKKEFTVPEGQAAEVESNLALIDQITKAAINLPDFGSWVCGIARSRMKPFFLPCFVCCVLMAKEGVRYGCRR